VGAFRALFPAQTQVVSGLDFVAELSGLEEKVKKVDLVITGEGSYDE
jgi:glycerate kinase